MTRIMTSEDYAKTGGAHCPACHSLETNSSGEHNSDGNHLTKGVECEECGAAWDDYYTLTGYADLDVAVDEHPAYGECLSEKEHAQKKGAECPVCRSKEHTMSTHVETDANYATRHNKCDGCHSTWNALYTLTGYINLEAEAA